MKKFLLLTIFAASFSLGLIAQQPFKGERIKALKVAFITQALNLTSEEAQKFWPVYNAYDQEIKKARQAVTDDQLKTEEAVLNIRKKYKPEFKKVLNDAVRVNRIFKIDGEFKEEVRKELLKRQQQKQQNKKVPITE